MGVSIGWQRVEPEITWLSPGWRSMMHELLLENKLYGTLDKDDIPTLLRVGKEQMKGRKNPPFDYSDSIRTAFQALVRAIRKYGEIFVIFQF